MFLKTLPPTQCSSLQALTSKLQESGGSGRCGEPLIEVIVNLNEKIGAVSQVRLGGWGVREL